MENTSRMPGERPVKNIMNFWKIVKSSFQYRWNIFFCIITALGVGVLWGTNLSAVFPFMQITFKGQTMQEWAADCVKESEVQIQALETRRAVLLTNAPTPAETSAPAETPTPESAPTLPEMSSAEEVQELPENVQELTDIALIDHKLQIERATHGGYVKLKEIIDAWLPTTPFSTIVLLLAALLAMTVLKTAFLIANSVLVSRIANLTILNIRNRLFDKCLALEFARYTQDGSAVLMSRITNDVGGIGGGLADVYGKMIREPLKMFVCMGIAISSIAIRRTFSTAAFPNGVTSVIMLSNRDVLRRRNKRCHALKSRRSSTVQQVLSRSQIVTFFDGVTSVIMLSNRDAGVITLPNRDFFDGVNRVPRDLAKPGSILTGHSLKQIADKPLKIAGITHIRTRETDVDLRDFPAIETVNSRNFRMDPCPQISHRHLPTNVSASASCAF